MKHIFIQLDTDAHPSAFDSVVATDSGADQLLRYGSVTPRDVEAIVHGAIFTRGASDLKNTAIFIGGTDADAGDELLHAVQEAFFGPMRVSVMVDCNGSNTTAAAAVRSIERHVKLEKLDALVLGASGPVGRRVAELLAAEGAQVRVASRSLDRAQEACTAIRGNVADANVSPYESTDDGIAAAVDGINVVVASGAAGVQFLQAEEWQAIDTLKVAVDLNAVPPVGLAGIESADRGVERESVICYGALGVGSLKMAVHRAAIARLFASNDAVLDTAAIYSLSGELD